MELAAGTLIGGRYRLERLLGRGGMGEVWAAQHTLTRREMALKFLNVDNGVVPQMRRRFLREARAATAVNHPNVIQIHDLFELEDETPVMVMDLLVGEALGDRLARVGALSVEDTTRIMAPVVSAVGTAHALGIVHRDVKPENIFLAHAEEGGFQVKVLDFGIAKLGAAFDLEQTGSATGTGAILGTPYYMALEQAYGEKDIDHRADVWSLGVVLYECLVGRRPIEGDNFGQIVKFLTQGTIPRLAEVAPHVPADLDQLVFRMLQRHREDRPQDLREVLVVLRRYTTATLRTFGGPRAPQISGVHDPADASESEASGVGTARGVGVPAPRLADPDTATLEIVTAERPAPSPSSKPSSSKPSSSKPSSSKPSSSKPSSSSRRGKAAAAPDAEPAEQAPPADASEPSRDPQVSTGSARRNRAPADVTLAESATAVPAPPPPAPSRRTAVIAAAGAVVGIALTAAVVLTVAPGSHADAPASTTHATVTGAQSTPSAVVQTPPPNTAPPVVTAPTLGTAAPGSVSATPVAPTPQGSASAEATSPLGGPRMAKPGPIGTVKPAASGVPSAKPVATTTPTAKPTSTSKGGLVDEPPF